MAKFTSKKLDQTVAYDGGFIIFKNGNYETTNKKQLDSLRNAVSVEEVGTKKTTASTDFKDTPIKE